jgi:hypothetical protein
LDQKKSFRVQKRKQIVCKGMKSLRNPSKNQDGVQQQQQQIVQSHENLRKILQARWCVAAADNSGSLRRNPSSKVFAELFLIP